MTTLPNLDAQPLTISRSDTDHLLCDESSPSGCKRCFLPVPKHCCDLHDPTHFSWISSVETNKQPKTRRSRLPKKPMCNTNDDGLLTLIEDWRDKEACKRYGPANASDYGGSLILSDKMTGRIVDCARHGKLHTAEDLARETQWKHALRYAPEILAIIGQFNRSRATSTLHHAPVSSSSTVPSGIREMSGVEKGVRRCTACRNPGHYSAYIYTCRHHS